MTIPTRSRVGKVHKAGARIWLTVLLMLIVPGGNWITAIRLRSFSFVGVMFLSSLIASALAFSTPVDTSEIDELLPTVEVQPETPEASPPEAGELPVPTFPTEEINEEELERAMAELVLRLSRIAWYGQIGNLVVLVYGIVLTAKARNDLGVTGEEARAALEPDFDEEGNLIVHGARIRSGVAR